MKHILTINKKVLLLLELKRSLLKGRGDKEVARINLLHRKRSPSSY